jgi:NAD(P)-dependent dehydrogenase (short-subunit alcohol dehydrogenase family)
LSSVAVVVGGTRRVGRWVSEALLVAGHRVHALYGSDDTAAQDFRAEMQAAGMKLHVHRVDATDAQQMQLAAAMIAEYEGGPIHILVNSAGPSVIGTLVGTSADDFEALFRGNVLLAHNALLACIPYLRMAGTSEAGGRRELIESPAGDGHSELQGGGRIISFIQSGVEVGRAFRDIPAYAASKAMLLSYSRSLARELAPAGITVNCIALGVAELPPDGVPPIAADKVPTGRHLTSEDVAAAIWYLTGPQASQVTGTVLTLGGGFGL